MSRIYVVRKRDGSLVRFVRANTLNGAVRALADEVFEAKAATTEDIYQATVTKRFDVLDALEESDAKNDKDDPGPMPLRSVS
jgi:hypothetical protein